MQLQIRHKQDVNFPLTFTVGHESTGEDVIVEVWDMAETLVDTINVETITGGFKGQSKQVRCDYSGLDLGNYYLVIRTEETGILDKGSLTMLSSDGFSRN